MTIVSLNSTTPLPIELLNFNAHLNSDNNVQLNWQTASEINNDYFTIERSINAVDWEFVKTIEGAGNSTTLLTYSTTDDKPQLGITYYRLKQNDFDGQFEYSQTVAVSFASNQYSELLVYPNPTNGLLTIKGAQAELETLAVYNVLGKDIISTIKVISKNGTVLQLDLSNLIPGIYTIKTKTMAQKIFKE